MRDPDGISRTRHPIVPLAASGTDFELMTVASILGLNSLHYSYCPRRNCRLKSIDDIRKSQARYTETLMDWIPRDARRILDVGCGVGDVARSLARRGRKVTALSPDPEHAPHFARLRRGIRFVRGRFEEFRSRDRYDLILMCESNNYFDPAKGLDITRRLLRPGGYLLISGIFKTRDVPRINTDMCFERDYRRAARARGFVLIRRQDITRHVLPMLDIGLDLVRRYGIPVSQLIARFLIQSSGLARVAARLLRVDPVRTIDRVAAFYLRRMDSTFFERNHAYVRCLYRLDGKPRES